MTVSSATNKVTYSGNGSTTVFAYTFKIFDQDDLTVILRSATGTETTQTITTHYSVSGVGNTGGGNVTMGTAPASGTTLTILREQPLTQGLDLVANDAFPAASMEDALDKLTMQMQRINEEIDRSIKASKTNTISSTEFTDSATDRASKVLAFDASGNLTVSQELGTFKGNWAASTAYVLRDLVKDTSTNNIFICTTAHTSSGSQPLTTNTDASKWSLLVDVSSVLALSGGTMTGNIVMAGSQTVDGRDLSVDGAKLDGIEDNSTADQTASEILTAIKTVDGASSGLDADLLDGQHGSYYTGYADTAVSNLVDSAPEALNTLNELAAALGDDANFSTTVTNSIATKLPLAGGQLTGNITFSGSQTVDGRDLSVDGAKLDLIEDNATADQTKSEIDALNINADQLDGEHGSYYETNTANVTAAGALMDSELTSEASVKAINQGLATSDSPTFNKVTMPLGSSSGVVIGSDDIKIYQAFGESYFLANSGNVNLQASENNHDVIIKSDDGSGGVAEYFKADGSEGEAQLFHYGDQKLSTKSTGVELYSNDTGSASGPIFSLHRDSSSPAAWDYLGVVQFNGEDSNSNKFAYASLVGRIVDPANGSTDGRIELWQMLNSTSTLCYVFDHDKFQLTNEQPLRWYNHGGTSYNVDLTAATPTADRTITLPNATGTVALTSDLSSYMPLSGGTFTGNISFEGATANDFETTVTVTDPTADRTITLPNQTGTVGLHTDLVTGDLLQTTVLSGSTDYVSFDGTYITDAYDTYDVVMYNVVPALSASSGYSNFLMRFGIDGTFSTSGYTVYNSWSGQMVGDGYEFANTQYNSTNALYVIGQTSTLALNDESIIEMHLRIDNMRGTSNDKNISYKGLYGRVSIGTTVNSLASERIMYMRRWMNSGLMNRTNSSAYNSILLRVGSGGMTSGTFKLYGMGKR